MRPRTTGWWQQGAGQQGAGKGQAHGKQAQVEHVPRVRQEGVRVLELVSGDSVLRRRQVGEQGAVLSTGAFQTGRAR